MRHIKVRRRADVEKGPFTALLKAAEKLDRSQNDEPARGRSLPPAV